MEIGLTLSLAVLLLATALLVARLAAISLGSGIQFLLRVLEIAREIVKDAKRG